VNAFIYFLGGSLAPLVYDLSLISLSNKHEFDKDAENRLHPLLTSCPYHEYWKVDSPLSWRGVLCGRFTLDLTSDTLAQVFGIIKPGDFKFESYNIAPSQSVPVIHFDNQREKELSMMHWGFIATWAKNVKDGPRPINARLETISENAFFKGAFQRRRCLIPASGFYEWDQKTTPKQPYYFYQKNEPLFAFAGIWNYFDEEAENILSFTLITKAAEASVTPVHNRMPFVLNKDDYPSWLNEGNLPDRCPPLASRPVSLEVNSPKNNTVSLIQ
jgi:putative SOS response-associated peptidase YedK